MKKVRFLLVALVAAIITGCGTTSTVPVTGRKQTLMVSDGDMLALSTQQYKQFMQQATSDKEKKELNL